MSEKTEMFDKAVGILKARGLKYIHLPNRLFKKNYNNAEYKSFPDLMFCWQNKTYMREYGIPGRNKDRKQAQWEYMYHWSLEGVDIKIIWSQEYLMKDFKQIGLIL